MRNGVPMRLTCFCIEDFALCSGKFPGFAACLKLFITLACINNVVINHRTTKTILDFFN